jgi:hypothetical protein
MNDNDLGSQVAEIRETVSQINRRIGGSWHALWRGILTGFGYLLGAFVAILIIGVILNIVGIIPAFKQQVTSFKDALQQVQQRQFPVQK